MDKPHPRPKALLLTINSRKAPCFSYGDIRLPEINPHSVLSSIELDII